MPNFLLGMVLLLVIEQCLADVHSLHRRCVATQGTSFPQNIQFLMVDDIMVYYYMTASKEFSIPQWLNHSEGVLLWKEIRRNLKYNRFIMDTAIKLTSKRFNHSHDHFYQAHGRCEWDTEDKYVSASLGHAYDATNTGVLTGWKNCCTSARKKGKRKLVTCHVTGFYPRAVQVEWLNQDGHLSDGVSRGEVLPNCDGTYQVKQTLKVPGGTQWSQVYRCQVIHSSVIGNITVVWDPKKSLFLPVIVGSTIGSIAVTVLFVIVCLKRGKCHQNPAELCWRTT
ncbi:uncharacterized protein LOC121683966 isoform X2 [Alosa sapidissima]|uniref:uncharacterized protein LOC121683966 isoform X2 n=1 Tax=Alosa sapidissima TaxID=34773 RepID=UPI001C093ABC|nr:uncharacterized protein LOC121683966 isoform X2 [Alosa sapidissima]